MLCSTFLDSLASLTLRVKHARIIMPRSASPVVSYGCFTIITTTLVNFSFINSLHLSSPVFCSYGCRHATCFIFLFIVDCFMLCSHFFSVSTVYIFTHNSTFTILFTYVCFHNVKCRFTFFWLRRFLVTFRHSSCILLAFSWWNHPSIS